MALTKRKVTRELLIAAANDINSVVPFTEPIPTGKFTGEDGKEKDTTKAMLEEDLKAVGPDIKPDEVAKLKPETVELLVFLGANLPEAPKPEEKKKEAKADGEKGNADKKPATSKQEGKKKNEEPGVIASILEFIQGSKNGIDIDGICKKLEDRFPDRNAESMKKTVKAQIGGKKSPTRMEREKKVKFKITNGSYSIAK